MLKSNHNSMSERAGLDHFLNSSLTADILSKNDLKKKSFGITTDAIWSTDNRIIVFVIIMSIKMCHVTLHI